jgi:hypothetical protein
MISTPAARHLLDTIVALLDQGAAIDRLSRLLTVTALAGLVAISVTGAWLPLLAVMLALSALAGMIETYLAMRVGFDAALFRRLAETADAGPDKLAELDAALTSMRLLPVGKAGRPLEARVAGARDLFYRQVGALTVQTLLLLLGASVAALR